MLHYSPYSELSKFGRFQVSSSAKITMIDCYCESCDVIPFHFVNWQKAQIGRKFDIAASFSFFFFFFNKISKVVGQKNQILPQHCHPQTLWCMKLPLAGHFTSHITYNPKWVHISKGRISLRLDGP